MKYLALVIDEDLEIPYLLLDEDEARQDARNMINEGSFYLSVLTPLYRIRLVKVDHGFEQTLHVWSR